MHGLVKARDAIRSLEQDGWAQVRHKGSHRQFHHPTRPGTVTVAGVPDLPGCVAVASTMDEARTLIAEAIEFHIEGMRLHGEYVPEPTTLADLVEVG